MGGRGAKTVHPEPWGASLGRFYPGCRKPLNQYPLNMHQRLLLARSGLSLHGTEELSTASRCVLWEDGPGPRPWAQREGSAPSWTSVSLATNSWWFLFLRSEGGVSGGILHASVKRSVGECWVRGAAGPSWRCRLPLNDSREAQSNFCRVPELLLRGEIEGEGKEEGLEQKPPLLWTLCEETFLGLDFRNALLAQLSPGCAQCLPLPLSLILNCSNTHQTHFLPWKVAAKQLYISNFLCSLLFRAFIYSWSMQSITVR